MGVRGSGALGASRYAVLAVGLLILTVYGSIIPLRYQPMAYEDALARYRDASVYDATLVWARGDWAVNAVQYAVLSFCVAAALSVDLRWVLRVAASVVVVPLGFLLASWVEFLQVYFPPRTVSVNDLIVERAGVVAGAVAWAAFGQQVTGWIRRFWEMRGLTGLARQALPMYAAALVVASLMPFDVVIDAGELAQKYRGGRIEPIPFARLVAGGAKAWAGVLVVAATFAPMGAMAAWAGGPSATRGPLVLGLGFAAALGIEAMQLFIYTRYCDATDVVAGTAGVMLGWWAAASLRDRRHADRIGGAALHDAWAAARAALLRGDRLAWASWALALVWIGALVAGSWRPFTFSTDPAMFLRSDADLSDENTSVFGLRRMTWAPFVDYYWNSRYGALDQMMTRALAFAPIGAAMAVAFGPRERRGLAAALALAVGAAVIIELGQYFIPERHPGTTDLLVQVFGAWFGFRLSRHVAHAVGPDREARGDARYRVGAPPRASDARTPGPAAARIAAGLRRGRPIAGAARGLADRAGGRLAGIADALARSLEPLPYPARVALIASASAFAAVGMVLAADRLGLL